MGQYTLVFSDSELTSEIINYFTHYCNMEFHSP